MNTFRSHVEALHDYPSSLMRPKMDSYKVDEGYSEDTRSQDGSESSMRPEISIQGDTIMQNQTSMAGQLAGLVRGLGEQERSEIAYDLLRGLRAASIASVFDRLWPLFHKDPLEVFPSEIMSLILSWLEPADLMNVSLVSRAWRDRVTDGNLWREKFNYEGWGLDTGEIERFENAYRREQSLFKLKQADEPFYSSKVLEHMVRSVQQKNREGRSRDLKMKGNATQNFCSDVNMTDADTGNSEPNAGDRFMSWSPSPLAKSYNPAKITFENSPAPFLTTPLIMSTSPGHTRFNYQYIFKQKNRLEDNWDKGRYKNFQLPHRDSPHEAHEECVYTIQYQGNYLVSGSRDRTLRVWNLETGRLARSPLRGHVGSVLCLQFDSSPEEDIIISGSSDTNVILWRFSTGMMIKKIAKAHEESVLNLRFDHRFLVTCSKDKTIKIWNRHAIKPGDSDYPVKGLRDGGMCPAYIIDGPTLGGSLGYQPSSPEHLMLLEPYTHLMTLNLHGAAVNAIQIYKNQLVSASGDRHLRVWNIHTGECQSKIQAHEKGIACVQYDGKRIVSGSSDNSIRIWDPATRTEVARLEGHERLVRTLQAAFADVPGGREWLEAEAAEVDRLWHVARDNGEDLRPNRPGRPARPGSRRPRDLRTLGAKIPPSGGGSRWARIISGSYDEKVIIWKKNADDEWVISHQLAQEDALTAAGPPLFPRSHVQAPTPDVAPVAHPSYADGAQDNRSASQPPATRSLSAQSSYLPPPLISHQSSLAGGRPPDYDPGSSHQVDDLVDYRSNGAQTPAPEPESLGSHHLTAAPWTLPIPPNPPLPQMASPSVVQSPFVTAPPVHTVQGPPPMPPRPQPVAGQQPAPPVGQPNARVFKLQFDARRIICCSQDNKIVGWDFANGDESIIQCSKFFAEP